jgi:ABC-2 type transport system ATP-binding protein
VTGDPTSGSTVEPATRASGEAIVKVEALRKTFGDTVALAGVDLEVESGTVIGLLGPNGAGKTTMINCLTTLMVADSGSASIAGYDVIEEPEAVRALIAVTGQFAAVDDALTGRENLQMFGELMRLDASAAAARAEELLGLFDLAAAADRRLRTYSGGMRRRLDLAASLVVEPLVLFLDEPTTGLDPRSRLALWEVVASLTAHGVTVFLTTQYLDEADFLADRIVVIDHGTVIAEGTSEELKGQVSQDLCDIILVEPSQLGEAVAALGDLGATLDRTDIELGELVIPAPEATAPVAEVVKRLEARNIRIAHVGLRKPTLDDVFMSLTGQPAEVAVSADDPDA